MVIKSGMLLAGVVSMLVLAGCNSNKSAPNSASPTKGVAATVNGAAISENLVSLMLKQRTDLGRPADAEARKGFIDRLAMQVVIAQEAVKKGLDKSPEVSAQIEMSQQSILASAFVQDYLKNNPVSDDAVKAEYDKMKADGSGREHRARHILVEQEAEAQDVIARLKKNPKEFEALAREKSKDPGSKSRGGDLGWFDPRRMVPEFGAALAKLSKGRFTEEPVRSKFGYHVILLEDSRPKVVRPLEQIKPELTQQLQQQNLTKLLDDMKAKAKIEIVQAPPGK
jgi:peptidyl-prolyl cis-trans isomerase C